MAAGVVLENVKAFRASSALAIAEPRDPNAAEFL